MYIKTKKQTVMLAITLLLIGVVIIAVPQIQKLQLFQQHAWSIDTSASAACGENGSVVIAITFTNTESPDNINDTMHVTAVDVVSNVSVELGDIPPGETRSATIETGADHIDAGVVQFKLSWTDGHAGSDTKQASYEAVEGCTGITPTPTIPACVVTEASCEWDASEGASGYSVTVTDHTSGEAIKTLNIPSGTTSLVFPAAPGGQYECSVVATNKCGSSDAATGNGNVCPLPTPTPTATETPTPSPTGEITITPTNSPTPSATPQPTATPKPSATPVPTETPIPTATPIPVTPTPRPTIQLFPTAPFITQPPPIIVHRTVNNIVVTQIITQTVQPTTPPRPTAVPTQAPAPTPLPVIAKLTPIIAATPTTKPHPSIPPTGDMENTILVITGTVGITILGGLIALFL